MLTRKAHLLPCSSDLWLWLWALWPTTSFSKKDCKVFSLCVFALWAVWDWFLYYAAMPNVCRLAVKLTLCSSRFWARHSVSLTIWPFLRWDGMRICSSLPWQCFWLVWFSVSLSETIITSFVTKMWCLPAWFIRPLNF